MQSSDRSEKDLTRENVLAFLQLSKDTAVNDPASVVRSSTMVHLVGVSALL